MEGPDFLFALQDKDYNFWQLDANGMVIKSSKPYFLQFSPSGWESISVTNVRNKRYWGIDRTVSIPLAYVNDGAKILKYIFYTLGIEESVYLVMANQQLEFEAKPAGTLAVVSGSNPFTAGTNTGTITGVPGSTVYVKMSITGNASDNITGNIGTDIFINTNGPATNIYPVVIPLAGTLNYNISFDSVSGLAAAGIDISTSTGSPTGFYNYWYKLQFRSEVDLSTFQHDNTKVTCTTLEDGLAKYLKANENTVYEFPLLDHNAVLIRADGIILHNKVNNLVGDGVDPSDPNYDKGNHLIDLTIITEDAPYVLGKKPVARVKVADAAAAIAANGWFLQATTAGTFNFTWDFPVNLLYTPVGDIPNPAAEYHINIQKRLSGTSSFVTGLELLYIPSTGGPSRFNASPRLTGSGSITVAAGDELYLFSFSNVIGAGGDSQISVIYPGTGNSFFNYEYLYRNPATFIKGFRPQYLYQLLVSKFTQNNYSAEISAYFEKYKNIIFTGGNGIRAFDDATIKINWSDFFQFWDSFDSVGISELNKRINFDRKQNLIDTTNFIDLPDPQQASIKISVSKDFLFNEYDTGYPPIKNDIGVLNGNEEYNDGMVFSLGTTKAPAQLKKISTVKASCYEIEQIRITYIDKTTTDYKNDNDTYVIVVEDAEQPGTILSGGLPYHNLDRSLNAGATGLIESATVFNIFVSPKRMILNNGPFIRSSLYLSDDKILKFISADKNNKLVAAGVVEKADVTIGSLDDRFFYPILIDAIFPSMDDLLTMMDINPLQLYRFSIDNTVYTGILQKNGTGLSNRNGQAFQFLSTATNNLTKLIDFLGDQ